jgi:hypothetical protein
LIEISIPTNNLKDYIIIKQALEFSELYRPLKKTLQYLRAPKILYNDLEIYLDIRRTRKELGVWAARGADNPDPNRLFAILSFTNLPMHAKFHSMVAKAMQLRGYMPLIFTKSGSHFGHEYYRMFGIQQLIKWDDFSRQNPWAEEQAQEVVKGFHLDTPTISTAKCLQFHGVDVGKHALSMVCRKRIEGHLDLSDPSILSLLREQLGQAVRHTLLAERFLSENPVEKMLVRDAGYIPNGPIYEVALNRGVDCTVLEFGQRRSTWIFKRYTTETRGQHYFSLAPETWENVKKRPWTFRHEKALDEELAARYHPDSMDDTRRLQSGKQRLPPDEVRSRLGLDLKKKTAVIFSHVAWDAAFFFGECLFEDFEDWLFQTVKFVSTAPECRRMNWIIKEHPFNVFKLQRERIKTSSEQRLLHPLMPLPEHVRFMPATTEINTQSLFPLVDCVLTVNGTVGMEFPCFGVPAVVAGTGRYSGYGFTIEPQTRDEYFEILRNLDRLERLGSSVQELARKHFYTLMIGKQISFEDIAPMELRRIHEAQSDVHDNISICARSLAEFRASHSMNLLGSWLANSQDPDLMDLPDLHN